MVRGLDRVLQVIANADEDEDEIVDALLENDASRAESLLTAMLKEQLKPAEEVLQGQLPNEEDRNLMMSAMELLRWKSHGQVKTCTCAPVVKQITLVTINFVICDNNTFKLHFFPHFGQALPFLAALVEATKHVENEEDRTALRLSLQPTVAMVASRHQVATLQKYKKFLAARKSSSDIQHRWLICGGCWPQNLEARVQELQQ